MELFEINHVRKWGLRKITGQFHEVNRCEYFSSKCE
jgi:hypothetical protein